MLLEQLLIVLLKHKAHLSFNELRQTLLHVARDFTTVLSMTIGDGEKVTVLEATEVRHSDPRILVLLVWVGRRLSCFSSEGKLCYAVGVHLSRIGRVVRVLLLGVSLPTASLLLFRVGENRLRLAMTCLVASLWVLHLLWVL